MFYEIKNVSRRPSRRMVWVLKNKIMAKAKKTEKKVKNEEIVLVKVFDKKSNRQRELSQEIINLEPTRYKLR